MVCDSINCVTFCDEAPSAIRTPISLVRCSTRYDSTLNSPDTVSNSASAAENQRHPERDLQEERFEPRHRPHGHDLAHVRIDPGEMVEERLPGQVGIALTRATTEVFGDLEAGRQKHAGILDVGEAKARRRRARRRRP